MSQRNIAVTLQCFVKKGNKYLMLHRNKNKRIMPDVWMESGVKREFNEGLFETTRRDIREVAQYIFSDNASIISYTAVYEKGNEMSSFTLEKS